MASIVIVVGAIGPGSVAGNINYSGFLRTSDMDPEDSHLDWEVVVAATALAATVNDAIKDAAIAVAEANNHDVDLLDKKTLICGAVGL